MELKEVIHFYMGCDFEIISHPGTVGKLVSLNIEYESLSLHQRGHGLMGGGWACKFEEVKPILRRLESMTEEELQFCGNMIYDFSDDPELNNHKWEHFKTLLSTEQLHYLLSKHFDLFSLIESDQAIDRDTLTNQ